MAVLEWPLPGGLNGAVSLLRGQVGDRGVNGHGLTASGPAAQSRALNGDVTRETSHYHAIKGEEGGRYILCWSVYGQLDVVKSS